MLPLIIILLLGIAAFGFALNGWIDEIQLTAESARMAAVDSEHGEGEVKPASFLKWITEQGDSSYIREAKATMCSPTSAVGDYVRIKMTYNYKWLGLGGLLGTSVETPLESNAYMRVEQAPPKEAAYSTTC